MLKEVILPTLGLDMEEAVISQWLKNEGETVKENEPLLVVETDKVSTEIAAPVSGVLRRIVQPAGATVPVTHTIAVIEMEGCDGAAPPASVGVPSAAPRTTPPSPAAGQRRDEGSEHGEVVGSPAPAPGRGIRASPAARKAARELGVELALVPGTGPSGRVQGEDVRRFAEGKGRPAAPTVAVTAARAAQPASTALAGSQDSVSIFRELPGRLVPLGRKRRVTAERMVQSSRSVARITLNLEVDAGRMVELRSRLQPSYAAKGQKLSYDALLVKAVGVALADHPYLNARWIDNKGIYLVESINVGVAVAVEDGLVVAVIRDAAGKKLMEVAAEMAGLLAKAREDRLTREEMSDGTFTITNLGMFGIDSFTPIVNPPEAAILGVGRIAERPAGRDGQLVLRPLMTLSLSVDHRVVDGAPAARFLQRMKELIEEPYLLL